MQLVLFLLAWFVFTFGPGFAITARLTRDLDVLRRVVVALGVGSAATPLLIDILGRVHAVPVFPVLAFALAGVGLWSGRTWGPPSGGPIRVKADPTANNGWEIGRASC